MEPSTRHYGMLQVLSVRRLIVSKTLEVAIVLVLIQQATDTHEYVAFPLQHMYK